MLRVRMEGIPYSSFCFRAAIIVSALWLSHSVDTLIPTESLGVGRTLVSSGNVFELRFFSPGNSSRWFLGVWYRVTPGRFVWVANRNNPLYDSKGLLKFGNSRGNGVGNLVLVNSSNGIVWATNSSGVMRNPVAQLLDTGNLVIRESTMGASGDGFWWQSFDYPSDTLLPGIKLGWDLRNGFEWHLTSWKSEDNPSPGDYVHRLESHGLPQAVTTLGSLKKYRSGPWNGIAFSSMPDHSESAAWIPTYIFNETDVYLSYHSTPAVYAIVSLNHSGACQWLVRSNGSSSWDIKFTNRDDLCDSYGRCGPNGFCRPDIYQRCQCLQGYVPKSTEEWQALNYSSGCVRKVQSNCSGEQEGFLPVPSAKLPDLIDFWLDKSMKLEECKAMCLKNCTCTAYANSDVRNGGSGCLMWLGDLVDVKEFKKYNYDQPIYLRLSASELGTFKNASGKNKLVMIGVIPAVSGLLVLGAAFWVINRIRRTKRNGASCVQKNSSDLKIGQNDVDLPLYDLATIINATDFFSRMNLIGRGGFGSVYKGHLSGKEVAVKRLSKGSGQGAKEFMNEAILIARLQHRNLVELLGCCIEGQEKILVYEYMPNKSLDHFIFDQGASHLLTWEKRFEIVLGVARGLLYLHQDSKLRVIHRDIKTSNILLDADMNPKISDFGLARIFGGSDKEARTRRIVGTYGYMPPEYAFDGKFSAKSDVYSFGVLLLEVVSGQRNQGFSHPDHHHNLLGHAWLLWTDGRPLGLVDKLGMEFPVAQAKRCIHVGLLCVQKFPGDRPSMASVVFMLANEGAVLPEPKQSGFFQERIVNEEESNPHSDAILTMTAPQGRR